MENKNIKLLESFVKYCKENPNQRFWQALRNWSGCCFIYMSDQKGISNAVDTFYFQGKDE